jgi:cobalamin biosynthesis protein CbiD
MTRLTTRLICAAAAAATTLVLFSSVVSIAEPQRSVLIAKSQHPDKAPARAGVTVASNDPAKLGK